MENVSVKWASTSAAPTRTGTEQSNCSAVIAASRSAARSWRNLTSRHCSPGTTPVPLTAIAHASASTSAEGSSETPSGRRSRAVGASCFSATTAASDRPGRTGEQGRIVGDVSVW